MVKALRPKSRVLRRISFWRALGEPLILAAIALTRPQPMALDPQRGLGAVADAEGLEDPRHMRLDRLLRDPEALGDHLVGRAVGQQGEHVELAHRQLAGFLGVAPGAHDLTGSPRRQGRTVYQG